MKGDEDCDKTEGCKINWKEGKNITVKTVKKTQKNKKSGQKRVISKEVDEDSFFNFFKDVSAPEGGEDDEEAEENFKAEEKKNLDLDIGFQLVDDVIPYSLEYYLGVKIADDEEGFEDEDEEEEDEEEDVKPVNLLNKPHRQKKARKLPKAKNQAINLRVEKKEAKNQNASNSDYIKYISFLIIKF